MKKDNKWLSFAQAKLEQELYNQMHNDWIAKNCNCNNNPNCIICNGFKKPTKQNNETK